MVTPSLLSFQETGDHRYPDTSNFNHTKYKGFLTVHTFLISLSLSLSLSLVFLSLIQQHWSDRTHTTQPNRLRLTSIHHSVVEKSQLLSLYISTLDSKVRQTLSTTYHNLLTMPLASSLVLRFVWIAICLRCHSHPCSYLDILAICFYNTCLHRHFLELRFACFNIPLHYDLPSSTFPCITIQLYWESLACVVFVDILRDLHATCFTICLFRNFVALWFCWIYDVLAMCQVFFRTWLSDPRGLLWCDIWLNFRMCSTVHCTVEFIQQDSFLFTKVSKKALSFATTGILVCP